MKNKPIDPQSISTRLKVLPLSSLILLITLFSIIFGGLIWGFTAWIPIKVQGKGITFSKEGVLELSSKTDGEVTAVKVMLGQEVKKGDLLIEIQNAHDHLLLQSTKIKLQNLENEYKRLKNQITIEDKARTNALQREIEANEFAKLQTEERIKSLTYEHELRKQLFTKGLISYAQVRQTEVQLVQEEIDIETVKSKIASLYVDISQGYRVEELSNLEWEIDNHKKELAVIEEQIKLEQLYAPDEGRILALSTDIGQVVKLGDRLMLIETQSEKASSFIIRGYFSVENYGDIVKGTPVRISFPHLRSNEYGSMLGVVESVSEYAISSESLYKTIYNKELIQTLLGKSSAVLEIIIHPLMNPEKPTEYLWTAPFAPPVHITTGTLCNLEAAVEERKPLYFIFPLQSLKRKPLITVDKK